MKYSTNIPNLISSIIDLIRDTNTISSITNSGTTYTINTNDTKRLVVGDFVKIGGVDYKLLTLQTDVKFTVSSTIAITGTSWTALAPYFYYGNPIMINNTINKIKDYQNKYPIFVLFDPIPSTPDLEPKSMIERTAKIELYLADEANFKDWTHDQYYSLLLDNLQLRIDELVDKLNNHNRIGLFSITDSNQYPKWTLVNTDTGKNVFDAELSAIGLKIDLPILQSNCIS